MKKKKSAPKAQKKVTLDRVMEVVQGGFLEVRKELGEKIDSVETRLTARIDAVEQKLGRRIDDVEQKVDKLRDEMISMHFDYKKVKARLENIELKMFGSIQE
jgi:tetrahydromethanopterin S-methyltransferase subunit G